MSRYINAGWLYGTLCNLWDKTDSEDFEKGVFETIINAPTADVVEVVRCGECKYMQTDGKCDAFADFSIRPSVSDYCSYGERRE